jgi:hypothetical protein
MRRLSSAQYGFAQFTALGYGIGLRHCRAAVASLDPDRENIHDFTFAAFPGI